ncbi:uncharacterized protein BCR38DRAFT_462016 [Pseudomassariella vexata]|uniref:Amino acid/polyamine transporter I n=1 Tax=Pseudomassariella vexata TaxID=1141098 RepID=A0A1Y2D7K1_9PEZI|nr:uncharacterized protein BCR38DRAFT_462016 [Pseudomassariella vexata]ORY55242.1 hypothetical protein BCR38DRAFT_462016 [Pseudomassariella vexata]
MRPSLVDFYTTRWPSQLFAFSGMYLITWAGIGMNMYYAILNGGPVAYLFNYLIVLTGVLAQAACIAELASIVPSPGRSTWLGYIATLASAINNGVINLEAAVSINWPNIEWLGWHTTLLCLCSLAFCLVINLWFFPIVPWLELVVGIFNVCFFFIYLVALWVLSPRNSADFIMTRTNFSRWDNSYISWNVGMLTQIWMFIGLECVIHMGEETKNARRSVPQAMFWSIAANGALGLIMVFTYILTLQLRICMPPIEDLITAYNPFIYLITVSTGSKVVATVMATGLVTILIGSNMSHRVPMRAVLFTCLIVAFMALLNIGSSTYVAFGALTSLSSLSLYFSYAIIFSISLHTRLTCGLAAGEWSIGRWGVYVNAFALVYTLYTMIWLPFPTTVPVTAGTMNYCGPVFLTVMIGALTAWIFWGSKHWPGPNQGVVEIVLRNSGVK